MVRLRRFALLLLLVLGAGMPVSAQSPTLRVTSPPSDAVINQADATIEFQVAGFAVVPTTVPLAEAGKRPDVNRPGEGHLHFMLDLQPVIVWERNAPYTLQNVSAGEHQLMVELVNNDHSSLSPPVVQHIRFRATMAMPATGEDGDSGAGQRQVLGLIGGILLIAGIVFHRRRAASWRRAGR